MRHIITTSEGGGTSLIAVYPAKSNFVSEL